MCSGISTVQHSYIFRGGLSNYSLQKTKEVSGRDSDLAKPQPCAFQDVSLETISLGGRIPSTFCDIPGGAHRLPV